MCTSRVVIIGSGIIGLSHAITAREAGHEVTVLEKSSRPLGASVRNFGTLWPIGLPFGPDREAALAGVRRWGELARRAGFHADPCGSLSLAHSDEAWDVLREFAETPDARGQGFHVMDPGTVLAAHPCVNPDGLRGGLRSPWETVVRSSEALDALIAHARALGVRIEFGTLALGVEEHAVVAAPCRRFPFDHLVIAAGEEMRLFYPEALARAGLTACQLQMMRTRPLTQRLGAVLVGDLTLPHYPAFRDCPSLPRLRVALEASRAEEMRLGIHVIAAQHADGTLTLGDSHEYGQDFDPDYHTDVEDRILGGLRRFARLPDLEIASRWHGVYLKSTRGELRVVLRPQPRVTMVTAMGGLGMTLSWALAEQTVRGWSEAGE